MIREIGVQTQVKSYQRLKKGFLMPPCLALSTIRWGSRVKWSNPGNRVAPSPTPRCSCYWKGAYGLSSTMVANFSFTYFIYILYVVVSQEFFHTSNQIQIILKQMHVTHRLDPNRSYYSESELRVLVMKEYSILSKSPELEPYHQMPLNIILMTPFLGGGVLPLYSRYSPRFFLMAGVIPLCGRYSQPILSSADWARNSRTKNNEILRG